MKSASRIILLSLTLAAIAVICVALFRGEREIDPPRTGSVISPVTGQRISPETAAEFLRIEARETKMNETVWAVEMLAQECGRTFEALWDRINAATNKLSVARSLVPEQIFLGEWNLPKKLPHEIELRESTGVGRILSGNDWPRFIEELDREGWRLVAAEFRHKRFDTNSVGAQESSVYYFSAHLVNTIRSERLIVEGDLGVQWGVRSESDDLVPVKVVDASGLTLTTRTGESPFSLVVSDEIIPPENSRVADPLIVHDLDGDGFSEIILAAKNLVYRRRELDRFEPEALCRYPEPAISTAVVADFDGDGVADFLCQKYEGVFLFKGSPKRAFDERARKVWSNATGLNYGIVLTCGDVDRDGDLDAFLGQYKEPYADGTTPQPFHDANDGEPAYLLLNDGGGNFKDGTIAAGLDKKRWRRTYSASFANVTGDAFLDLVVVSDFAGVDLYQNDGKGRFSDVTPVWVPDKHAFGMAHVLADFNVDGRLDILMTGMTSPAVDRLEHFELERPGGLEDRTLRSRMTHGTRLYVARGDGKGFVQNALSESIARSGWSWGCTTFDMDNDSYPDVYIANGLESNASVRDYEAEYWLHDRFLAEPNERAAAELYFKAKYSRTRGADESYGGYEKNRFYLNQNGTSFLEAGSLFGVALEQDSRNVVADDLDGDGRCDLIVTTLEIWPKRRQTLRIYRNNLVSSNHWIGFRFRGDRQRGSSIGASVTLRWNGRATVRQMVTGDSYRSQHANTLHFGLGTPAQVETVEIRWPNGDLLTMRNPTVNHYHWIGNSTGAIQEK